METSRLDLFSKEFTMSFIGDFFSSLFGGGDSGSPVVYDDAAALRNIQANADMQMRLAEQSKEHEMQLFAQRSNMAAMQAENEKYLATLEEKTQQDLEAMLSGIAEGVEDDEEAMLTSIDFTNFFDAQAVPPGATGNAATPPTGGPLTAPGGGNSVGSASPNVRSV